MRTACLAIVSYNGLVYQSKNAILADFFHLSRKTRLQGLHMGAQGVLLQPRPRLVSRAPHIRPHMNPSASPPVPRCHSVRWGDLFPYSHRLQVQDGEELSPTSPLSPIIPSNRTASPSTSGLDQPSGHPPRTNGRQTLGACLHAPAPQCPFYQGLRP